MTSPSTYCLTLPGPMLQRGFWLYVWRVEVPGEAEPWLYVGRTGDNSSPNAGAPYTRMGQHLGSLKNQNALRKHLIVKGLALEECTFHLISHGPLHPEVERPEDPAERKTRHVELMQMHCPLRNEVGAYERDLALALAAAGYQVLNTVKWKHMGDPARWSQIRAAFAEHFPKLEHAA